MWEVGFEKGAYKPSPECDRVKNHPNLSQNQKRKGLNLLLI
jgi:hypothetical protein